MRRVSPVIIRVWSNFNNSQFKLDYPRTLREWGRRLDANLTQDLISKDYPALKDRADYDAFKRKWQYLFVYASAGFAQGYITCHMLTFIREVGHRLLITYSNTSNSFVLFLQNDMPT